MATVNFFPASDNLDDIVGPRSDVARNPQAVRQAPDGFIADRAFVEGCPKCRGSGQTRWGVCFKCKGLGQQTFKTSPEARAQARVGNTNRKANQAEQSWMDFAAAHPVIAQWIMGNPNFSFAVSMKQAIEKYGDLTDAQLNACQRCVDKEAAQAADRAATAAAAPSVDTAGINRLKLAFDTAIKYAQAKGRGRTLKSPKITIGNMVISPAKATSNNPGALYVKVRRGEYLGKIQNGRFFGRNCEPQQEKKILAFIADPKAAAEAYGQETGMCCICNATLTNKESIERGIGPICGEKFGW